MEREESLFKITWPIFVESVLFMLLGSIDIFMLGKFSDNAVASVGIVNQIISMFNLIFGVITTGTMIICAQYIGANNRKEDIIRLTGVSLMVNTVIGILVSLIMVVFDDLLLKMMNVAPELTGLSSDYIKIVGGFLFVQAISMTFTSIIRSHGFTKVCMYVTLGMNIFNVLFNYSLIFGNFVFPQLGVRGAAISTVISKLLGTIILGYYMFKVVVKDFSLKYFAKFPIEQFKKIISLGIPSAGEQISYNAAKLVGTVILTYISIEAITANSYVNNIIMFIYIFSVAIGQGTAILVGRLVGKGDNEGAYKLCMSSFKKALVVSISMAILIGILGRSILSFFTNNEEVISLGAAVLFVVIFLEPGRVFNIVIINSLRAAGDVKFPVYIGICSMWTIAVGLAYILSIPLGLGLVGMWIALALDEWVRGVIMYFRWKSKKWEHKSILVDKEEVVS